MKSALVKKKIAEGFKGQIHHVIPRPLLSELTSHPIASTLYLTDIGWYPEAKNHFRSRPQGCEEFILICCVKGKGSYSTPDSQGQINANEALLIPHHLVHQYQAHEKDPWSIFYLHFSGTEAKHYSNLLSSSRSHFSISPMILPLVKNIFLEGCHAFKEGFTTFHLIYASQLLRHLLSLLFYRNPAFNPKSLSPKQPQFNSLILYMKMHLNKSLTLAHLAQRASLSQAHFSALFFQQTGFSPIAYHIRLRIQNACLYLNNQTLSIKEVANHCGYEDPYYFSRIFHQIMGLSPREYRNKHLS